MTVTVTGGITFSGGGLTFAPSGAPSVTPTVEYLVVAGGGGASGDRGGGGGAGGYRTATGFSVTSGTPITVTVGGGGNGGLHTANGTNGSDSLFVNFS
jgi:hypothetical protein